MKAMNYTELWNSYKSELLNFIKGKTETTEIAEDLLQEVALKFYVAFEKQEIENYKAWLYQVTRNTIADYFRSEAKKNSGSDLPDFTSDDPTACVCDLAGFVIQNYLPEKYSTALYLSDIELVSQKEIAEKLNLSLTAAKSRIQRARKMLKEKVEDCVNIEYKADGSISNFSLKNDCQLPPEMWQEMQKLNLVL